jgi:hypothetical protein
MPTFNLFRKSRDEPLKHSLDTIFEYAEKSGVREIVFEPRRATEVTETEGVPAQNVPPDSVVLFVFYRINGELKRQLSYGYGKEELMEELRRYSTKDWLIGFENTDLGDRADVRRL